MPDTVAELLKSVRQLPAKERGTLLHALQEDEFTAWQREAGNPEPGYEEWFRASVEEARADTTPGVPHEEVVEEMSNLLRTARESQRLKARA